MNPTRRFFLSQSLRAAGVAPLLAIVAGCGDSAPAPSSGPPPAGAVPAPVVEDQHQKKGKVADPQ